MNLMEMAKKQKEEAEARMALVVEKIQGLQNETIQIQGEIEKIEKIEKMLAGIENGQDEIPATFNLTTFKTKMARLWDEKSHRFMAGTMPALIGAGLLHGRLLPDSKGIVTLSATKKFLWSWYRNYMENLNWPSQSTRAALVRVQTIYGLEWPSHAAGMKVS